MDEKKRKTLRRLELEKQATERRLLKARKKQTKSHDSHQREEQTKGGHEMPPSKKGGHQRRKKRKDNEDDEGAGSEDYEGVEELDENGLIAPSPVFRKRRRRAPTPTPPSPPPHFEMLDQMIEEERGEAEIARKSSALEDVVRGAPPVSLFSFLVFLSFSWSLWI
jgi:hypothetical protein